MTPDPPLQKADFDDIYDQPDPRAYFTTLEPFDYVIPQHGATVFTELLKARAGEAGHQPRLLDVCCSYGVVATLLKTDLAIADVYAHYREAAASNVSTEALVATDQRLLKEHQRPGAPNVVGLDVAQNAVEYAVTIGALDAGFTENLEVEEPSSELAGALSDVDLITTTGGVGYVTDKTFDRLLEVTSDSAWVAAFCLRTYEYDAIAETVGERGLVTERLPQTFRQRRFTGPDEQDWAVSQVRARGVDPTGKEAEGYYHAEFYLSRPAADVARKPLEELLPALT